MNDTERAEGSADATLRRFSRFYTRRLGLLRRGLLDSPFSLSEARVVFELASRDSMTAVQLAQATDLDPGYLSRMLGRLLARGLVRRGVSATDRRKFQLSLTDAGRAAFAALDSASQQQVRAILAPLDEADRERLAAALTAAETLLGGAARDIGGDIIIRGHRPGDLGWVVHRHGALYAREYGWDDRFEALVAGIVARFIEDRDPLRDRCWIAERGGAVVGSVFVVRQSDEVAKLRLLYVEPVARGSGIGQRLVEECKSFARQAGYRRMVLWTNDVLVAARRLYGRAGFQRVGQERHHSFGHDLVGEEWARDL